MAQHWHYLDGTTCHGPVSSQELKQLAQAGKINAMTPVRLAEQTVWIAAGQVRGLEGAIEEGARVNSAVPPPLPRRNRAANRWPLIVGGSFAVAAAVGMTVLPRHSTEPPVGPPLPGNHAAEISSLPPPSADDVYDATIDLIRKTLKAPKSAEFAAHADVVRCRSKMDVGTYAWWVTSYYDAQNPLGVFLRGNYVAQVQYTSSTLKWHLEALNVNDEIVYLSPKLRQALSEFEQAVKESRERAKSQSAAHEDKAT